MAEPDLHSTAIDDSHIQLGRRVRFLFPPPQLELGSDTGTVIRPDVWDGYYIVQLDAPAILRHGDDPPQEIGEIAEAADNLESIGDEGSGTATMNDEAVEARVRQWLTEAGFDVAAIDPTYTRFNVAVTYQGGPPVTIHRREDRPGVLVVTTYVEVAGDMLRRVESLPELSAAALSIDLAIEYARLGIDSDGVRPPLRKVTLAAGIYDDELSKSALVDRVLLVRRAVELTILVLTRATLGMAADGGV